MIATQALNWRSILHWAVHRRALMQMYGAGQGAIQDASDQNAAQHYEVLQSGVTASWWLAGGILPGQCAGAYQAKSAASYAASKINLNNPGTNNLTDSGNPLSYPSFNALTGWTFDGDDYLLTGLSPVAGWSIIAYISGAVIGVAPRYAIGSYNQVNATSLAIGNNGPGASVLYFNGSVLSVAPNLLVGSLATSGTRGYRNGIAEGAAMTGTPVGVPALTIGCMNFSAVGRQNFYVGDIWAVAIYNVSITAAQVLAVHTAMVAL